MTPSNYPKSSKHDVNKEAKSNSSQDPGETTVISPRSPHTQGGEGEGINVAEAHGANGCCGVITLNTKNTSDGDDDVIIVDGTSEKEAGERASARDLQESYVTLHKQQVIVPGDTTATTPDGSFDKETGLEDERMSAHQMQGSSISSRRHVVILNQVNDNGGEELAVLTIGDFDSSETFEGEKIPPENEKKSCADKERLGRNKTVRFLDESKNSKLYEARVESSPIATNENGFGLSQSLQSDVTAFCRSVNRDLDLSETSVDKEVCLDNDIKNVDEKGVSTNPQIAQMDASDENEIDGDGDSNPVNSFLDEGNNLDSSKASVGKWPASEEESSSGAEHRMSTSSPRLQACALSVDGEFGTDESNLIASCSRKSREMVLNSSDTQEKIDCALREGSFPIHHENMSLVEELSRDGRENLSSECVGSPHGVVESVLSAIIHRVAAANDPFLKLKEDFFEFSRTTREPSTVLKIGHFEDEQQSFLDRNDEMNHALQKDLTMSNNSRSVGDQSNSLLGQEHIDHISNGMVPVTVEHSPPEANPVDHPSPVENDNDDDNDDDDDDDASDEDLQINQISSPVDPDNNALSDTNLSGQGPSAIMADIYEEGNVADDASFKKSFGKLDESEVHFLKNAIGEILKTQKDQQGTNGIDTYSSLSLGTTVTMSHHSSATENSTISLQMSGSAEINTAEFDFASVIPRCKGFVISATDRTEADAQTLLTHVINGDPDPCLGPDGFVLFLNQGTETKSDGRLDTVSSKAVEQNMDERNVTLHNTASTGNDVNMPVFGQSIVHNTHEESCVRRLSRSCGEDQSGEVGEKKQTVDEKVCVGGWDSSSFIGEDKEDDSCCYEGDKNNKGTCGGSDIRVDNSPIGLVTIRHGADGEFSNRDNATHTGDKALDDIDNANSETENLNCVGVGEKNDLGYSENKNVKQQPPSSVHVNSMPSLNTVSEEDLRKYENSNVIYKVVNCRDPGLVDGKSEPRLVANGDAPSPSSPGLEKLKDNLPQEPENECEECDHVYDPQSGQDSSDREVKASLDMAGLSPEYVTGSICPCNSEICTTDASKYVFTAVLMPRGKRNVAPTSDNVNQDTIARKTTNQNQTKVSFGKARLLPEILKKQMPRGISDRFPKRPSVTNNLNARRAITSVKTMASSSRAHPQTEGHPNSMTQKAPHSTNAARLKKPQNGPNIVSGQTFGQGTPMPLPTPGPIDKTPRKTGRRPGTTVTNQSQTTKTKLRPVTASPQNVNANKLKYSKRPIESCTIDSYTLSVHQSSSSSSNNSFCTNSSFFPDVVGASNQDTDTKYGEHTKKRIVPSEASSQITGLKDDQKSLFPDVFDRSLQKPKKEPTKMYAPKKHLKAGVTPAEEYHRYKMDLRLCRSLAKIKRGPPTVDCYLDPRLKPRNARSRSSSQRRGQINCLDVMDNLWKAPIATRTSHIKPHLSQCEGHDPNTRNTYPWMGR